MISCKKCTGAVMNDGYGYTRCINCGYDQEEKVVGRLQDDEEPQTFEALPFYAKIPACHGVKIPAIKVAKNASGRTGMCQMCDRYGPVNYHGYPAYHEEI